MRLRNWKAYAILSVLIPMSLFATFRLTGVLKGPQALSAAVTTTLAPLKYEFERPDSDLRIPFSLNSSYVNEINLSQELFGNGFFRHDDGDQDRVALGMRMGAFVQTGFVYAINLTIMEEYEDSRVYFETCVTTGYYCLFIHDNLTVTESKGLTLGSGVKASMTLVSANLSKSVHWEVPVEWILGSAPNTDHLLNIAVEIVYNNGTVYKDVIQPYSIRIYYDSNNSFETATEVSEGNYTGYVGSSDSVDYYKINLTQGQDVSISVDANLTVVPTPDMIVFVYAPEEDAPTFQTELGYHLNVEFNATSSGYWFIEVRCIANAGVYFVRVGK